MNRRGIETLGGEGAARACPACTNTKKRGGARTGEMWMESRWGRRAAGGLTMAGIRGSCGGRDGRRRGDLLGCFALLAGEEGWAGR